MFGTTKLPQTSNFSGSLPFRGTCKFYITKQEKDHGEKSKHEKECQEKTAQDAERKKAREKRKEKQGQRGHPDAIADFNRR
jgi:hypothetical protein